MDFLYGIIVLLLLYWKQILVFITAILLFILFIVLCVSAERLKNEAIIIRELLENINKIEIARYKKEFEIQVNKKTDTPPENIENILGTGIDVDA